MVFFDFLLHKFTYVTEICNKMYKMMNIAELLHILLNLYKFYTHAYTIQTQTPLWILKRGRFLSFMVGG